MLGNMRLGNTWLAVIWLLASGCDTSIRQVGPGSGPLGDDTAAGGNNTAGAACDQRELDGSCVLFTGPGWDPPSMQGMCSGTLTQEGCPDTDLGGCKRSADAALEQITYYYTGLYYVSEDEPFLRGNCESNYGQWL